MADDSKELLFFDTFSHENTEELNLDLVQFPRPVLINEVRVIPLGTRVQVDVPGGTRLGATNPSSFKLELFVTNLTKPNAATFEHLGTMEYLGNENIQMVVADKIPTDGVIIKGWYSAITIALYGCCTTVTREKASPPPPPPPRSKTTQMVIPPTVVENAPVQQAALVQPPQPVQAKAPEWGPLSQQQPFPMPGAAAAPASQPVVPPGMLAVPPPLGIPPAPVPPSGAMPPGVVPVVPGQPGANGAGGIVADLFSRPGAPGAKDVDERFPPPAGAGAPPGVLPVAVGAVPQLPPPCEPQQADAAAVKDKEKPKLHELEMDEHGKIKIPQGEYESDELFKAYLAAKDRKKEEREREKQAALERERERGDGYRREGHSETPDRAHTRDHGRSTTRSRSRSTDREYRRSSRERDSKEYRSRRHGDRDRDSEREYRGGDGHRDRDSDRDREYGRDRYDNDRERGKDRDSDRERLSDSREGRDESKDRDSKSSKDRQGKDRDRSDRKTSVDRDRDRSRDSPDRSRERSSDRAKSPKGRGTPRRSRSRTPQRRSRSRSRERNYERNRGRESRGDSGYSRDREREYGRSRREGESRDRGRDNREGDRCDNSRRDRSNKEDRARDSSRDTRDEARDKGYRDSSREHFPDREYRPGADRNRSGDIWGEAGARSSRDSYWNSRGEQRGMEQRDGQRNLDIGSQNQGAPNMAHGVTNAQGWGNNMHGNEAERHAQRGGQWGGASEQTTKPEMGGNAVIQEDEDSWEKEAEQLYPADDEPPPPPQPPITHQVKPTSSNLITLHREIADDGTGAVLYEELAAGPGGGGGGHGGHQHHHQQQHQGGGLDDLYTGLSDGEIEDADAYSDISSDENFLDSLEMTEQRMAELQNIDITDDAWNYAISNFNPYQCDLTPMEKLSDPSLTEYEIEKAKLLGAAARDTLPPEAALIRDTVEKYKTLPHHRHWIEAMEELSTVLPVGLSYIANKCDQEVFVETLDVLIAYTLEGLEVARAMAQPETTYKVRHLKMGVRAAGALCSCDAYVTLRFLSKDVQMKLLELFECEHMAISVKAQIIKALDSTTRLKDGLEWFVGKHSLQQMQQSEAEAVKIQPEFMATGHDAPVEIKTPYQRLIHILTNKQVSRVAVSLTALAKKIHTFELITRFAGIVEKLSENQPTPEVKAPVPASASASTEDDLDLQGAEPETFPVPENFAEADLDELVECLREIVNIYLNAEYVIAQPKRTLPNQTQFEIQKRPFDPYPHLYHMLSCCGFLECLFVLLSSPATFTHTPLFNAVKDMFTCLINKQSGLKYLCANYETVNGITRTLTQTPGYNDDEEESRGPHPAHVLGLQMIYYLQAMQSIDRLYTYHAKDASQKSLDDAEPLGVLHNLYLMTFSQLGKDAVVDVFTMHDNLAALMPFIEFTDIDEQNIRIKRCVCHSYTVLLLLLVVRESTSVGYLETFGAKLLAFTNQEPSTKTAERVAELQDWLAPMLCVPAFTRDAATVAELLKLLKQHNDDVNELPKALVTVLRILQHMSVEPDLVIASVQPAAPKELKYKFCIIELFHGDVMPMFVNIIQKISEMLTRACQDCIPTMGQRKAVILSIVRPTLHMMRAILSNLIAARDSEFADRTALQSVFHLHTMLCSVSHTGTLPAELQLVQNLIVDILHTYTQPSLKSEHSGDAIAKSLWSLMVKDLFSYVVTSPYTFLSGLILISELLPLPLPIQTKEALSEDEVLIAVNQRKLWAAHLHPLSNEIQEILKNLSGSACQPLQQLLRRVCWQLADLAASSALMVVRCLVDTLLDSIDASATEMSLDAIKEDTVDESQELRCSGETAKILNLLAFLMNQPPVKAAFIHLTYAKAGVIDEKYGTILDKLAERLNGICNKPSHVQAQESIVSIFHALCDLEVTMVPTDAGLTFADQLSNSVPGSNQMALMCRALLQHVNQADHSLSSILPALRTLSLLMLHDYGFYHAKQALDSVPRAFYNLFERINNTFSKDSSDCIATLSSAIELLQFLVALPEAPEGEEPTVPFERTYLISYGELRSVLQWTGASGHPLADLDSLLQAYAEDEDTLKAVYDSVSLVVSILKSDQDQDQLKPDMTEPTIAIQDNLQAQFELRSIFVVTDEEDDRLSATYWLATPMGEEIEETPEFVSVDFQDMAHKYCQDFDVRGELEKGAVRSDPPLIKVRRRGRPGRHRHEMINTSKHRAGNRGGFVAPMRGRGFGRGMSMPISKNDLFRSRPQNTSRPPSMHVDDFIKMELQGTTPAIGPTGMNPHLNQYREKIQSHGSTRGRGGYERGRGRGGMSDRGRGAPRYFGQGPPKYGSGSMGPGGGGYDSGMGRGFGMKRGGGGGAGSMRGGGGHSSSSATGGYTQGGGGGGMQHNKPIWAPSRPTRPPPGPRAFDRSGDNMSTGHGGFGMGRGGWQGGGGWRGGRTQDDRRFGGAQQQGYTQGGYMRRDMRGGRHQRSFTK